MSNESTPAVGEPKTALNALDLEAVIRRSKLISQMLDKEFWDIHMVDIKFRFNGKDVWEEADWIKDLWGMVRRAGLPAPEPASGEGPNTSNTNATQEGAQEPKEGGADHG